MGKELPELTHSIGRRVVASEAGRELELTDHRLEGAVLVVRRAEVAQPGVGFAPQFFLESR